jgi:hypothetical protein
LPKLPAAALGRLLFAALVLAGLAQPSLARGADPPQLQALKAGFLFNFARFTTWPEGKQPVGLVRFCPIRGSLDPALFADWPGKQIHGRPVDVRILASDLERLEDCHVVFASERGTLTSPDASRRARSAHVLLVSDTRSFARAGGHIGLVEEAGRLRFQVNLPAVRAAGLKLSARMLRLARIVNP